MQRKFKLIISWAWLGLLFGAHIFRLIITGRKEGEGLKKFLQNYHLDNLAPLSSSDTERSANFSNCIGCGICDFEMFRQGIISGSRSGPPRHEYPRVSVLPACFVRSMPDFFTIETYITHLENMSALDEIFTKCPCGISISQEISFVKNYLKEARRVNW